MTQATYDYPLQDATGATCTAHAWAKVMPTPSVRRTRAPQGTCQGIAASSTTPTLVAHYYVDGDLQDLALETGGCVADSLEMARFGKAAPQRTLVVAGVRFMGETSKILSPGKRVLMPDLDATCSLDLGCPADDFATFCDAHPDRTVVVYANTSAAVKARADWMVTSSCALAVVNHLKAQGKKILWAPDRHLGRYIQDETGADMLLWNGACIVHDEFKSLELELLKEQHPDAMILVHPESPKSVVQLADVVGSTSQMLNAVIHGQRAGVHRRHRQRHPAPHAPAGARQDADRSAHGGQFGHVQELRALPVDGDEQPAGARSTVCRTAPARSRSTSRCEVDALGCIQRMLDFVAANPSAIAKPARDNHAAPGHVPGIGAA